MTDFLVQLIATIGLLYGLWQAGNVRLRGPLLACLSELATTTIGITHGAWSIIAIGGILFFVQGRNFLKWRREGVRW